MSHPFAMTVCLAFGALALWHFYMALLPGSGESGAVPSVKGKPLFVPSRKSTVTVGVVLLLFAGLVAATAGIVSVGRPRVALLTCRLSSDQRLLRRWRCPGWLLNSVAA
jgi:hypothetical protein